MTLARNSLVEELTSLIKEKRIFDIRSKLV